jgi:hypothetical protein
MVAQFLQVVPVAAQAYGGRQSLCNIMLYACLKYYTSDKRPRNLVNCVQRTILAQEDTGTRNNFLTPKFLICLGLYLRIETQIKELKHKQDM